MVGFGAIYSYAAFADQITADFAADRGSTAFVYALAAGGCFFVSALSGRLADRVGARPLAAAGMVLVATGFLVAASASTLLQVLLGYGLLVGLGAGAAYVPAVALVQRWFVADRGLASGLAVSGIGVATALVPSRGGALRGAVGWPSGPGGPGGASPLRPPPGQPVPAQISENPMAFAILERVVCARSTSRSFRHDVIEKPLR
jgi:MFS family permease